MGRFQLIEKEINKGISVDEKSNTLISNWSPNNVRRLIIGFDYAIVQYFVTGGRYNKLVEIVDLRTVAREDFQQVSTEPQKYKSILTVLTSGRVCSSIEEIVFAQEGYPDYLLSLDTNLTKLAGSNTTLDSRFPRLRQVSIVPLSVRVVADYIKKSMDSSTLLLDVFKENMVNPRMVLDQNENNWWRGSSLRPKYYKMDDDVLPKYFDKIKSKFDLMEREDKLDEISFKKDSEVLKKNTPALCAVIDFSFDLLLKANSIFEGTSTLSKAEWSSVLQSKNIHKGIRLELIKNESLVKQIRGIDFDKIEKLASKGVITNDELNTIQAFRALVFMNVLTDEDEYKRDSNKLNISESLMTLQRLVGVIFGTLSNIIYLSLAKYLTRNTPDFADFFNSKLSRDLSDIQFTRSIIEYCNNHMKAGWAKKSFDTINATEVMVEQHKLPTKYADSVKILTAFNNVK